MDAVEDAQVDLDLPAGQSHGDAVGREQRHRALVEEPRCIGRAFEELDDPVDVGSLLDCDLQVIIHRYQVGNPSKESPSRARNLHAEPCEKQGPHGHKPGVSPSSGHGVSRDTSFERLYRRHRRDVYGAVLRDVRDPDEAEDVTQIAFLNAFRAIRRGEEPEKPRAWLVTIAKNVVRRRYRALATRPQEIALDPELAPDLVDLDGPTAGEIAAAIRRLPPNQRAVILLREIQGRSYAEIAEELDLSLPAVETLIFRARGNLSEELRLADHVPATRARRAGRLRSLFPLPLPGLGKLSFGFLGRAGTAAFVGGVAIMTVPVGDIGTNPPAAAALQRPSASAERAGSSVAPTALAPKTEAPRTAGHKRVRQEAPVKRAAPGGSGEAPGGVGGADGAVGDVTGALPTLSDPVPLPVTPPALPSLPVTPPALPPLPVEPPALPPPPDLDLLP
jgi:RNA polymerase sigma factor (sigma-70 family)